MCDTLVHCIIRHDETVYIINDKQLQLQKDSLLGAVTIVTGEDTLKSEVVLQCISAQ